MKKEEILKKLESGQGDTDYVFRTQAEDKTFLENHKQSVIDAELPQKVNEIHTRYDDDLFELFGVRKKGDQKTYNFLKEQFGALKTKASKVETLETEIAELRKGNPTDAKRLAEIAELQNTITTLKKAHETELSEFASKMQRTNIISDIKNARGGLKIKKDIPESVIEVYLNTIADELAKNAEHRDGKIVFLDPEKKTPLRNPSTMVPYTTAELVAEKMKDLIDVGIHQKGPGIESGKPPVEKKDGKFQINFQLPADITSREKLGPYLIKEHGLKSTSPEYREAYKTLGENLPAFDKNA
jgi:hypothetical protein